MRSSENPARGDETAVASAGRIAAYLHRQIPISQAMGIEVVKGDLDVVELVAPLKPNLNHRSTVFGGSSAAIAILAAWTLVYLRVNAMPGLHRVVIQHADMEYDRPITGEFRARCESPDDAVWNRFSAALRRYGRARARLSATVIADGQPAGRFVGNYAAIRIDDSGPD